MATLENWIKLVSKVKQVVVVVNITIQHKHSCGAMFPSDEIKYNMYVPPNTRVLSGWMLHNLHKLQWITFVCLLSGVGWVVLTTVGLSQMFFRKLLLRQTGLMWGQKTNRELKEAKMLPRAEGSWGELRGAEGSWGELDFCGLTFDNCWYNNIGPCSLNQDYVDEFLHDFL